jgi:hypothetical protein
MFAAKLMPTRGEPLTVLHSNGRLLALPANIRLILHNSRLHYFKLSSYICSKVAAYQSGAPYSTSILKKAPGLANKYLYYSAS